MTTPQRRAKRCYELIESLNDEAYRQLREHAEHRLAQNRLWHTTGRDLVQDAIVAVLSGLENGRSGRHPRDEALTDESAFLRYLKGVLNSLVEAETRRREHHYAHKPLDGFENGFVDEKAIEVAAPATVDGDISFLDLVSEFFRRMRIRCPTHLQRPLEGWHEVCGWSEEIPVRGFHRRHRAELKAVARQVSNELGFSLG